MESLEKLIERIVQRVNTNLREQNIDVNEYLKDLIPINQLIKFYAFYGITPHHPLNFHFRHSNLSGSYFLGKCFVSHSILYKSDIRGDELKGEGSTFSYRNYYTIPVYSDECIKINNSYLIKTLVHNYSHDPENLEEFNIQNTISTHYANIHGSPTEGCFLGPFSTIDLTTVHDSVIGSFAYLQLDELAHSTIEPGTVWIKVEHDFDFKYQYNQTLLAEYISFEPGKIPQGIFMDFVEDLKVDFQAIYDKVHMTPAIPVPDSASLDRYALVQGKSRISRNVLVAQRAYLEDASLGRGANAQENCYIISSNLDGYNVTAHGGKIIYSRLGQKVFVGFNSFLKGKLDDPLIVGDESIIMPHTIIHLQEPLKIPSGSIVWGLIRNQADLKEHCLLIEDFSKIEGNFSLGNLKFSGSGKKFIEAFKNRIEHILKDNGAYYDGKNNIGHAQRNQNISFNMIQPYPEGELKGLFPTIEILP